MMLNTRRIREQTAEVKAGIARRGEDPGVIDQIVAWDSERRALLQESEALKAERNRTSKTIGASKDKEALSALREQMRAVGRRIKELDGAVADIEQRITATVLEVPNVPHHSVPSGTTEEENIVTSAWGEQPQFGFAPQAHWDIGAALDILDFPRGAKIAGAQFALFKGNGSRLLRALGSWMLDLHVQNHGYLEVWPPFVVRREVMTGTGQLPKFEEDMYRTDPDDLFLIPTAEVPVTNIHRDEILDADALPLKYTAYTPCFRREAGAAGKDTRGLLRMHQFEKVEMVKFVKPETSYAELESLREDAEEVLQKLDLPYRVVELCGGELGFAATKCYDLEVWCPGIEKWQEVSSCSNFEDFQARRINVRYRPSAQARPEFVHTLNGSGLAFSARLYAAVLENNQQADGSVVIPEVLRPYLGGMERLSPAG